MKEFQRIFFAFCSILFAACSSQIPLKNIPNYPVQISNLGAVVNSSEDDFAPSISANGRLMVFTSGRKAPNGTLQRDFWMTTFDGVFWTLPQNLGTTINTEKNEGTPTISMDGQELYFAACNRGDILGRCDLYHAELDGKNWIYVRNLGAPINTNAWEAQPSIAAGGRTLYFVSDRPGGHGGLDIWRSERDESGSWKIPENLGSTINTPADEVSPFIASDGMTLYFASNGHPGLGGTDMFVSRKIQGTWSEPKNLGAPLNSAGNDEFFALAAEGNVIFFASQREGGFGGLDLYRAEPNPFPPGAVVVVSGVVRDRKTKAPIGATISVIDNMTGKNVGEHKSNEYTGEYVLVLPAGSVYSVQISVPEYIPEQAQFDFLMQATYAEITRDFLLRKDVPLPRLSASVTTDVVSSDFSLLRAATERSGLTIEEIISGETVPLLNYVFFDSGKSEISMRYVRLLQDQTDAFKIKSLPEETLGKYYHILNIIGLRLRENPSISVQLVGTTDTFEKMDDRLLSLQRAESVKRYLTETWRIDPGRISTESRSLPDSPSSINTLEGQEENRRVEIVSSDPSLLEPIEFQDVQQLLIPAHATFNVSIEAEAGLEAWRFEIEQEGYKIRIDIGNEDYPDSIVWNWRNSSGGLPVSEIPFMFRLYAKDKEGGEVWTNAQEIPITFQTLQKKNIENLPDRTVEKISLILFDFDRADISPRNRRILKSMTNRLSAKSTAVIRGYTDIIGDDAYNQKLSEKRSSAVMEFLDKSVSGIPMRSEGVGESDLLYPNDLPEGRFYSRTVQILIETMK